MSSVNDLETAKQYIDSVINNLNENPDKDALTDLLDACEEIEFNYKNDFCPECDENFDYEPGSAYKDGVSMEYYIESSAWHKISLALRKLRDIGAYSEQ